MLKNSIRYAEERDIEHIVAETSNHFIQDNNLIGILDYYKTDSDMLRRHITARIQDFPNNDFKYPVIDNGAGAESFICYLTDKKKRFGEIVFMYCHNNNEQQLEELVQFAIEDMIANDVKRMKFEVGPGDDIFARVLYNKGAKKVSETFSLVV